MNGPGLARKALVYGELEGTAWGSASCLLGSGGRGFLHLLPEERTPALQDSVSQEPDRVLHVTAGSEAQEVLGVG